MSKVLEMSPSPSIPWWFIQEASNRNQVEYQLVGAIIRVESGGNQYAMRYEKDWKYSYLPLELARSLSISLETEIELQKFSYGFGQLMGSVLRELGFKEMLPKALSLETNITYTALKLSTLLRKHQDIKDAISAYNQGTPRKEGGVYLNEKYVEAVYQYYKFLKA